MKKKVQSTNTLLDVLKQMLPQTSSNTLRKMLTNQRITVDGETIHRAKHTVEKDQTVEIHPKPKHSVEEDRKENAKSLNLDIFWLQNVAENALTGGGSPVRIPGGDFFIF